jgi:hypothetical protein
LKKTLPYILLFLFLFNILGYYFIFEVQKYHVKKEMQARVQKGSTVLTILRVMDPENNPDFQRVEKMEIRYKGSLYDVIKEVQKGRTTIFYCIHDKKEENLLAIMKTVNKDNFLLSIWDHVIKIAVPPFPVALSNPFPIKVIFPQISVTLPSALISTWSPPPEYS